SDLRPAKSPRRGEDMKGMFGGRMIALSVLAIVASGCSRAESAGQEAAAVDCDKACLEDIAAQYRAAYLAHDPSIAPFGENVRYTENNVEMPFPDGTWDTVTEDVGPALIMSDPEWGQVAIFTPVKQREIEGYLGARLKVEGGRITEVEHIISTRRNLSTPPTPIAPIAEYQLDPLLDEVVLESERATRDELAAHANGYFDTLQMNDGEIRGTCFKSEAIRRENGMLFEDIKGGFESGRYLFNNRVRREVLLIDEERQI